MVFLLRTLVVRRAFRLFSDVARRAAVVLIAGLWASAAQRFAARSVVFWRGGATNASPALPQLKLRLQRLRPRTIFSPRCLQRDDLATTLGGAPRRFYLV